MGVEIPYAAINNWEASHGRRSNEKMKKCWSETYGQGSGKVWCLMPDEKKSRNAN